MGIKFSTSPREKSSMTPLCPLLQEKADSVLGDLNQMHSSRGQLEPAPTGPQEFWSSWKGVAGLTFSPGKVRVREDRYLTHSRGGLNQVWRQREGSTWRKERVRDRRPGCRPHPNQDLDECEDCSGSDKKKNCAWDGEGKIGLPRRWALPRN